MELAIDIERLKKKEEREFKHLYEEYFPLFFSFAKRFVLSEELCQDVVQEVFLSYLKIRTKFDDAISLKVFFYRSIRNRCLNLLREAEVEMHDLSEVENVSSQEYLEEAIIEEEVSSMIYKEIEKLPGEQRDIILLSMQGISNQEIADQLAISINTLKKRKIAAYASLRISLKDLYTVIQILSII